MINMIIKVEIETEWKIVKITTKPINKLTIKAYKDEILNIMTVIKRIEELTPDYKIMFSNGELFNYYDGLVELDEIANTLNDLKQLCKMLIH